jgi:CIC family chloride channel protein
VAGLRPGRFVALGRRAREVLVLSALTGIVTGAGVALFEWVARDQLADRFLAGPVALQIVVPAAGLLLAGLLVDRLGGRSAATADEYIRNFHEHGELPLRPVPARLLASALTLGSGGALGYEGPSIYLGAAVGSGLQRRLTRLLARQDAKLLMVCGAAAGVAAIFKAPATGLVFALEVPYQEDFARRMLLPAGIAAAASYLTFAALVGTAPLFVVEGSPPFDLRDLGGAVVLGVACGLGARLYTRALVRAKTVAPGVGPLARALVAGAGLAAVGLVSWLAFDRVLTFGAGYDDLAWALDPRRAAGAVLLLLGLRAVATVLTLGGGGAGGLFIPLVIEGALLGRVVGGVLGTSRAGASFLPVVGVSAFLGAGYRVPLAGVMFAAEATGRPGFVVPGLIASVVAQLFMGGASASPYQMTARAGHLERRLLLPLAAATVADVTTAGPAATVAELVAAPSPRGRSWAVPVVDAGTYLGMIRVDRVVAGLGTPGAARVVDHLAAGFPTVRPGALVGEAMAAMEEAGVDVVPVVDGDGRFLGVVTFAGALRAGEPGPA